MEEGTLYSLRVLAEATGDSYRTCARRCGEGPDAIIYAQATGEGHGRRIKLSLWDVLTLFLVSDLRQQGASLQKVRKALATLKEKTPGLFDRVLVDQLSPEADTPRPYIVLVRDGLGQVKDLAVRELGGAELVSLVRSEGQVYFRDVVLAAKQMQAALAEADERIKAQPRRPRYRGVGKDAVLMEV